MNLQKKFRFGLLTILAGLIVSTLPLAAQQVYKGTFDLPVEARWSSVTLQPGKYTITVEQSLAMQLIRVRGERGTAVIVAGPSEVEPITENGRLTFAHTGEYYAIAQLDAGPLGRSFNFPVPKSLRAESARGGEKTTDTVVLSTP